MASSQDMRTHSPPTFFIGYFRRRSPWTSSRAAAPLAQWAPRLIGLSQAGSCPIQTSLRTSAITVQATAQWVQTDLMISTLLSAAVAAEALVTVPPVTARADNPPMARPEPRRKARRSTDVSAALDRIDSLRGRPATPFVFFLSISFSRWTWA